MIDQYLLNEYKKKLRSEKLIVKHLRPWWWITTSILTLIAIFFAIDPFHWKSALILYRLSLTILFLVIVTDIFFVIKNKYGGKYTYHEKKREFLIDILKNKRFYNATKIEYLIQMINDSLASSSLRISKDLFKPLVTFFLVIVFPLLLWWFNTPEISKILARNFALILTILFQLLGFFYLLKPIVESTLDGEYFALKELQLMLKDIYLTDFCGRADINGKDINA